MTVHVEEIHTDVITAGTAREAERKDKEPSHLGAAQEAWLEARRAATMWCRRTAARDFDD
jgi:hypothetical protein